MPCNLRVLARNWFALISNNYSPRGLQILEAEVSHTTRSSFPCYISPSQLNFAPIHSFPCPKYSALQVFAKMLQRLWYPSSLCFLLLLPLPLLSSASVPTNPYYVDCSKPEVLHCGKLTKINITYPFRQLERPNFCGYPGYELNCNLDDETVPLTIKLGGEDYAVLNIFHKERVVVVVDSYFLKTGCPLRFTNASINSTLFSNAIYDSNLTVYVNCSFTIMPPPQLLEITCPSNGPNKSYYIVDDGPSTFLDNFQGSCELTAALLVYDKEDFDAALKGGFGLTWNDSLDWCKECMDPRREMRLQ